jgi:3-methyladenine DNA glycosylase AlkD
MIDCTAMIIQTLFARESDEDIRVKFTKKLIHIATTNQTDLAKTITETSLILRGIKEDRITRASSWAAHGARRAAERDRAVRDARLAAERKLKTDDIEFIFADVFCDILDR